MIIEVGKTYISNFGKSYTITKQRGDTFTDGDGRWWDKDGTFLSCFECGNWQYNLKSEA